MKTRLIFPCAFAALASSVHAAPLWWDNSTNDGLWATVANWSTVAAGGTDPSGVPGAGDIATFSATGVATPQTITLSGPQSVLGIAVETAGVTTLQSTGSAQTLSIGNQGINVTSAAVTALNIGPLAGTAVNVRLTDDQSWTWGGANAASQGIFVRGTVSNTGGSHTLTLGGSVGSTAVSVISGAISDGDGVMNIVLNGSSTNNRWNFSGNNSYTGTTTITQGALGISNATSLGATGASSGTSVAPGAALFIRSSIANIAAETLSIAGQGPASAGALRNVAGDSTWNGTIAANASSTVSIGADSGSLVLSASADITTTGTGTLAFTGMGTSTATITVNGDISGAATVAKTGSATSFLTFGGDSKTYTGATNVTSGILTLNTTLTQSSGINVASAGILRGNNGLLQNATADATVSGILRPGALNSTIGSLGLGRDLTFGATGRFEADIQSSTLTGDLVTMTGNLNIDNSNAAVLAVSDLNPAGVTSGVILLLKYGGLWNGGLFTVDGNAITDNGTTFVVNGNTYQLDYDYVDGTGKALAMIAVPEPSGAMLLAASAGLFFRRRRKGAGR